MKSYVAATLSIAAFAVSACNSSDTQIADRDSEKALANAAETDAGNSITAVNASTDNAHSAAAAKPAPLPNMNWYLRIDEAERNRPAVLAYEQPDTDNQSMILTCEEGGMRVFAGIHTAMPKITTLTLTAGGVTIDASGTSEPSELDDSFFFETSEIAADSRFFDEFARTGWLSYAYYRSSNDLAGTAAGDKAVKDFVAHCRNV